MLSAVPLLVLPALNALCRTLCRHHGLPLLRSCIADTWHRLGDRLWRGRRLLGHGGVRAWHTRAARFAVAVAPMDERMRFPQPPTCHEGEHLALYSTWQLVDLGHGGRREVGRTEERLDARHPERHGHRGWCATAAVQAFSRVGLASDAATEHAAEHWRVLWQIGRRRVGLLGDGQRPERSRQRAA